MVGYGRFCLSYFHIICVYLTNSSVSTDFSFWFYVPNKGAAVFFTLAFLATTALHYWQCQ